MWVSRIELTNIKSYEGTHDIHLDKRMNIFIGPNNAGKSVITRTLYHLQKQDSLLPTAGLLQSRVPPG